MHIECYAKTNKIDEELLKPKEEPLILKGWSKKEI